MVLHHLIFAHFFNSFRLNFFGKEEKKVYQTVNALHTYILEKKIAELTEFRKHVNFRLFHLFAHIVT